MASVVLIVGTACQPSFLIIRPLQPRHIMLNKEESSTKDSNPRIIHGLTPVDQQGIMHGFAPKLTIEALL